MPLLAPISLPFVSLRIKLNCHHPKLLDEASRVVVQRAVIEYLKQAHFEAVRDLQRGDPNAIPAFLSRRE